jgi:hypothetical protein
MVSLNLKSGAVVLASIRTMNKYNNNPLILILTENTLRFAGSQNGQIYFEIANLSEFDLTIDVLNTNKHKINKIRLLRLVEAIKIERNETLGCAMFFEGRTSHVQRK